MLVPSWLLRAADRRPDHDALITERERLSYRELRSAVDAAADRLWRAGARAGERVVLALPPGRSFVVVLHAVLRLGAVAVPLDPRLPADERERRSAGAAAIVEPASDAADWRAIRPLSAGEPHGSHEGARLLDHHDLDATAIVVHTSGTSGPAKPIPLTYGNWLWSAIGSAATLGCPPDERWLCAMPLHHVGGLSVLLRSAIAGTTAVVHGGWDTERVLAALTGTDDAGPEGASTDGHDRRPTMVSLVPTTLRRLLDAGLRGPGAGPDRVAGTGGGPAADADRAAGDGHGCGDDGPTPTHGLRWVLLGGAAIPAGLLEDAAAVDVPVAPTYGMSEATSQIATLGPPLFCTTVRIDDPRSEEEAAPSGDAASSDDPAHRPRARVVRPTADADVVGEILVRGPTVAAVARGADGWLRTGDLGRLDARGHLAVVGRTADTIISGGENVLPLEVERVLDRIDGIRESAVFGRPDPEWGERVCAKLIVEDPAGFDVDGLRTTIRPLLAAHQRPRDVELVDELPRTPSGKLLRRALR